MHRSGNAIAGEPSVPVIAIIDAASSIRAQLSQVAGEVAPGSEVVDGAAGCGDLSVVFVDIDRAGVESIARLALLHPGARIVCLSKGGDLRSVVLAIRAGAFDYLVQPLDPGRLREVLGNALRGARPRSAAGPLTTSMVGDSPPMKALAAQIRRVQQSDVVVSLYGETGTGKELVARAIHDGGPRRAGPFVAINCASIPQQLQESELFGHERGSFTGAVRLHRGCFEQANQGTLFLDEIAEMSLGTQASLLRTLEEHRIRRLGGTVDVPVDIRIICATHRNLAEEVQAGRFRKDLYFRLVVYPIQLAPLRDRAGDILVLVAHFLEKFGGRTINGRSLCDAALQALSRYSWPGNVRELENVARRILLASDGDEVIGVEHLPQEIQVLVQETVAPAQAPRPEEDTAVVPFREMERRAILRALDATQGNIDQAARMLGMSRATLYRRLARLNASRVQAAERDEG